MKKIVGAILAAMIFFSAIADEPGEKKISRRDRKEMRKMGKVRRKDKVRHSKENVKYHKRREKFDKGNVWEHPKSVRGTEKAKIKLEYDKEKV